MRLEQAEFVLAELLELAPSGLEEVQIGADIVEYALYGAPGELPALPELSAAAGGALVEVRTEEIAEDWVDRWRQFHRPVVVGDTLTVRPPWEPPGQTAIDVVIDPGQAFGTGAHPTTRLCLELMASLPAREMFLDLGCGSGVLAIAAAKLGWTPVLAVDNDARSIEATRANAKVNGVAVQVRRLDLRREDLPGAPTVAANLLGPLLHQWLARLPVATTERVIASGLLTHEADGLACAFASRGLPEAARRVRGEWAALLLARPR
ncbi:MAG: 50S ribosomal protein L11 methyltransferase [Solirubrobacteraceae bacterium]